MPFPVQTTATTPSTIGRVAIDEHSAVACLIHDATSTGLRLTVLDGSEVPDTFVLFSGSDFHICHVARRSDEEIEACFAPFGTPAQATSLPVRATRSNATHDRRHVAGAPFRRAA